MPCWTSWSRARKRSNGWWRRTRCCGGSATSRPHSTAARCSPHACCDDWEISGSHYISTTIFHLGMNGMATKTVTAPAKATITAHMAEWAADLKFEHLSSDAVYQAKRFLLDSIGCALGGYQQHDVKIALEVMHEIAGRGMATVIGTGKRIDPVSAALA